MPALCTSSDGAYVFLALEDTGGNQKITKAARADLSSWSAAYDPGGGSAANVAMVPSNPDLVIFYGNFGSGIQVVSHVISTGANTNISPSGLTTKVVNTLAVNPSNADEIIITVDTDQDVLYTDDAGTSWTALDSALGFDATALYALWSGQYEPHRYFVAGNTGVAEQLLYSPNEGASDVDYASAGLAGVANVCGIDVAEV